MTGKQRNYQAAQKASAPRKAKHPQPAEAGREIHSRPLIQRNQAAPPAELGPDEARALQPTIGNRAVNRLLARDARSQRLRPSQPRPALQRQIDPETEEDETYIQRQPAQGGQDISADIESSIQSARGNGQPLADNVRASMENAFSADFSKVSVHTDSEADALNRSVQARAFTTGQDIFFKQDEYNPGSHDGRQLIAHELTHVVQQNGDQVSADANSGLKAPASLQPEQVLQREVDPATEPGRNVIVTSPKYKMKYRKVAQVVRPSRQPEHLVVAYKDVLTPESADGFRFPTSDLDYAPLDGKIPVITMGSQTFILVGTTHGAYGKDVSGNLPPQLLQNAAIVIEYPPLFETGRNTFSPEDMKKVNDKTQAALAAFGAANVKSGVELVGADGRKAFLPGNQGQVNAISIRNREAHTFTVHTKTLIDPGFLWQLAAGYVGGCLGIGPTKPGAVSSVLLKILSYNDETDLTQVLANTHARVSALTDGMDTGKKAAIGQTVLKTARSALQTARSDYEEYVKQYEGIKEREPEEGTDSGPQQDYSVQLVESANNEMLSAVFDAICNLLLFTEVVASQKEKVVVAFGAEHIPPLQELLGQLKAQQEH